jgi:DNA modification methylase
VSLQPYYEHGGITIYNGECGEVVDELRTHWGERHFDLLLTDPPYGIGADRDRNTPEHGWVDYGGGGWDSAPADPQTLAACRNISRQACIWGGNYFILPPTSGWLVWDKGQRDFSLADGELAWTSEQRALRIFSYARGTALRDGKQHPTQKPLALMAWCLGQFPKARTVFDPYMGTGTTLVEVKRLGLVGVGIEQNERYCEIAAKRLAQEALPLEQPA